MRTQCPFSQAVTLRHFAATFADYRSGGPLRGETSVPMLGQSLCCLPLPWCRWLQFAHAMPGFAFGKRSTVRTDERPPDGLCVGNMFKLFGITHVQRNICLSAPSTHCAR